MYKTLSKTLKLAALAAGFGTLLAGCVNTARFETVAAACAGFERPEYQIKGKTSYDQNWADDNTEVGVAGCGWARPKPRPAYLDMPVKAPKKRVVVNHKPENVNPRPAPVSSVVPVPSSLAPAAPTPPKPQQLTRRQRLINKIKADIKKLKEKLHRYSPHDKPF